jgi:hypothetical protein
MYRAALGICTWSIAALFVTLPGSARGDDARPPAWLSTKRDPRSVKLEAVLRHLQVQYQIPTRVVYRDASRIEIAIPKMHVPVAELVGVMALADTQVVFEMNEEPPPASSFRDALAGGALSIGLVAAGIWFARGWRRKTVVSLVILIVCVAAATGIVVYNSQPRSPATKRAPPLESKWGVDVVIVERTGPVEVRIPTTLKPTGTAEGVIDNWTGYSPRPNRPPLDKK